MANEQANNKNWYINLSSTSSPARTR